MKTDPLLLVWDSAYAQDPIFSQLPCKKELDSVAGWSTMRRYFSSRA